MSAIDDKYNGLGGPGGWLGRPVDEGAGDQEMPTASGRGRVRDYQNGSIYWTPETGPHEVHGDIRAEWAKRGWETGRLGYPVSDELPWPDGPGRMSNFQGGSILWRQANRSLDVRFRID